MEFDEDKVTSVLLRGAAWLEVKAGSFKIISYGWSGSDAFECIVSSTAGPKHDRRVVGPVKSVVAVKTRISD